VPGFPESLGARGSSKPREGRAGSRRLPVESTAHRSCLGPARREQDVMAQIAEGRKAPVFTLENAEGERVSLADFKGKDVIVYF
jgi:AhpC/TSA family